MIKPFWKSKMILFNVLAGVAIYFFNMPEVGASAELLALITAGINVVLRTITNAPVGLKAG